MRGHPDGCFVCKDGRPEFVVTFPDYGQVGICGNCHKAEYGSDRHQLMIILGRGKERSLQYERQLEPLRTAIYLSRLSYDDRKKAIREMKKKGKNIGPPTDAWRVENAKVRKM